MATVIPNLLSRVTDLNGAPVSGAKLYVYLAGTTTPTSFYTDSATTVAAANPLSADSGGLFVPLWAKDGSYKIVITDSSGGAIYTLDNYTIATAGGGSVNVSAPVVLKTANYTVQASDRNVVFICDASAVLGQNINITAAATRSAMAFRSRWLTMAAQAQSPLLASPLKRSTSHLHLP